MPATTMGDVVGLVGPFLRERGFGKQRHAFARAIDGEFVQAIAFQMGQFQPREEHRPGLYGAFTVELGVWFAAVARCALDAAGCPRRKGGR